MPRMTELAAISGRFAFYNFRSYHTNALIVDNQTGLRIKRRKLSSKAITYVRSHEKYIFD